MTKLKRALDQLARTRKPKRKREEHQFQTAAYEFLELALPDEAIMTSIDHANAASAITGAMRKARGVLDGIPDTLITWQPDRAIKLQVVVWLETKSKDGRLRTNQGVWRDILRVAGHYWAMPRTIEEIVAILTEAGIPLKARLLI